MATSSPKAKNIEISEHHKDVPEATARPEGEKQDLLLDEIPKANSVISSSANSPNVASVNPQTSDGADGKPGMTTNPDNKDLADDTLSKPK